MITKKRDLCQDKRSITHRILDHPSLTQNVESNTTSVSQPSSSQTCAEIIFLTLRFDTSILNS